ncbi:MULTISPECIES: alpha/beta hydrolase [unclassified Streptomyces]|uniref:alpha/beta fold hydrolase n=1 Tax=unclassified Streptomyces TaxID=2593676 RepID=UPI0033B8A613
MDDAVVKAVGALVPGGASRGELDRHGRTLRWIEAGEGAPAVVLDAPSAGSSMMWTSVLAPLARCTRVIAYDRAGLGLSDPVPRLTLDSAVEDLAALLARAGGGPCVLVGNSWGGQLAELLAWAEPDLVAGLVLLDPSHEEFQPWAGRMAEGAYARQLAVRTSLRLTGRSRHRDAVREASRATDDPRVRELLVAAWLAASGSRQQVRTAVDEYRMIVKATPEIRRRRAASRLPDVPVTVLSASRGMPQGMRRRWTELQKSVAASVAGGEHTVVPAAGHYIQSSRPDVVTQAVLAVLERARPTRGG